MSNPISHKRFQTLSGAGQCGTGSCNCAWSQSALANPASMVQDGMLRIETVPSRSNQLAPTGRHCGVGSGCGARAQEISPVFGSWGTTFMIPNITGSEYFRFARAYGNCSNVQASMMQPTGCNWN